MKGLKNFIIKEGKEITYRVSFLDFKDEEDLPITTTILVDSKYQKEFEDFLNKNEGDIFFHAEGGNVEY